MSETVSGGRPRTLAEKVWDDHVVARGEGEGEAQRPDLIFIDLHLVHEVTSPQAFDGLRLAGRQLRRPDLTLATEDHNVPTDIVGGAINLIADQTSRTQIETLRRNCEEFGVRLYPMGDREQGIVHVVGPQLGLTQPGMTVVCGDSHTSTHGAFGAIAMGIGTSEVEHVMATQTLSLRPFKTMAITVTGELQPGVTSKDLVLAVIAQIGTGGGQGHIIEYRGEAIEKLSMESRMTVCNMSIEAGARAGMIAPDQTTFDYLEGRPHAPQGDEWEAAVEYWRSLRTDDDAVFDTEVVTAPRSPRSSPGGPTPARAYPWAQRSRTPSRSATSPSASLRRTRWSTWISGPTPRCGRCPSTWCLWAPAPTAASRTCVPSPRWSMVVRSPTTSGCSSFPAPPGCASRPRPRGWARSSPRSVPSGASPDARCAWV